MKTIRIDLGGAWQFSRTDGPQAEQWPPGHSPGCVQTDFAAVGRRPGAHARREYFLVNSITSSAWQKHRPVTVSAQP